MGGEIACRVGWGMDADGSALCPPQQPREAAAINRNDAFSAIGATGIVNPTALQEWLKQADLDPNDPRNAELLHVTKAATATTALSQQSEFFRLTEVDPIEHFPDVESAPKRERLMRLRQEQVGSSPPCHATLPVV